MIVYSSRTFTAPVPIAKEPARHDTLKRKAVLRFGSTDKPPQLSFVRRWSRLLSVIAMLAIGITAPNKTTGSLKHERSMATTAIAQRPRTATDCIGWNSNVRVLASSGQDFRSWLTWWGTDYTKNLDRVLRTMPVSGLEHAHAILQERGYSLKADGRTLTIFPPSTPRKLLSWQIPMNFKTRYALLIGQQETAKDNPSFLNRLAYNKGFRHSLNRMEKILRDKTLYNLPESHILRLDKATYDEVEQGILWLRERLKENPGSEALIYYSGHGLSTWPTNTDKEGDTQGSLAGPRLWESDLKKWVNEYLNPSLCKDEPPPILIILDACFSGSLIADNHAFGSAPALFSSKLDLLPQKYYTG